MKTELDILANTVADAQQIAGLLRFFRPPPGVMIRFWHPSDFELDFELEADWLECIGQNHKEPSGIFVVNSFEQLQQIGARLYYSSSVSCLQITEPAQLEGLSDGILSGLNPCALRNESQLLDATPRLQCYDSVKSWMRNKRDDDILITTDANLRQALLVNQPEDLWSFEIGKGSISLALNLDGSSEAYLRAWRQLATLCIFLQTEAPLQIKDLRLAWLRQRGAYSFFAEFYDRFMAHVDYQSWIDMIFGWLKVHLPDTGIKILEIACGTANISEQLVFQGFDVYGCDASPFMLHEASKKHFAPRLFLASMDEKLPFANHFDLVLCLFDSINYLMKPSQIADCLRSVQEALKPGGIYVFDVSTLDNSQENFFDMTQIQRFEGAQILHHALFDEASMRQSSALTLFRKKALGYVMSEEHHTQRVYRHREILDLISQSGMELLGIYTPQLRSNLISKRNQSLDERYPRLFYMLRKKP